MESPTVNLCARSRWMVTAGDRDLSSLPTAEMLETVRTLNVEPPLWMDARHCDGRSRKSRARGRGSAKQPWEDLENSRCRHAAKTRHFVRYRHH